MKRFRPGVPSDKCAFPKPTRVKRKVSGGRDVIASVGSHDGLLWGCIGVLQDSYPEFPFLHVPNSLYEIIGTGGDLSHVLPRCLGFEASMALKQEIADSIKSVADLVIWSPVIIDHTRLSIAGEIKTGPDKIRKGQRDWAKGALFEWRSVDEFKRDMKKFKSIYHAIEGKHHETQTNNRKRKSQTRNAPPEEGERKS